MRRGKLDHLDRARERALLTISPAGVAVGITGASAAVVVGRLATGLGVVSRLGVQRESGQATVMLEAIVSILLGLLFRWAALVERRLSPEQKTWRRSSWQEKRKMPEWQARAFYWAC